MNEPKRPGSTLESYWQVTAAQLMGLTESKRKVLRKLFFLGAFAAIDIMEQASSTNDIAHGAKLLEGMMNELARHDIEKKLESLVGLAKTLGMEDEDLAKLHVDLERAAEEVMKGADHG